MERATCVRTARCSSGRSLGERVVKLMVQFKQRVTKTDLISVTPLRPSAHLVSSRSIIFCRRVLQTSVRRPPELRKVYAVFVLQRCADIPRSPFPPHNNTFSCLFRVNDVSAGIQILADNSFLLSLHYHGFNYILVIVVKRGLKRWKYGRHRGSGIDIPMQRAIQLLS
jgi:hypothetical protein